MAIDENYISEDAIAQVRAALVTSGEGYSNTKKISLTLEQVCFIFGLTNKDEDGVNQQNLQDAYDWIVAEEWPELGSASISWMSRKIVLYPT
jgi:hypothetical protein